MVLILRMTIKVSKKWTARLAEEAGSFGRGSDVVALDGAVHEADIDAVRVEEGCCIRDPAQNHLEVVDALTLREVPTIGVHGLQTWHSDSKWHWVN